ncbi:hypothetical protein QR680_007987 [Steinernema hermaphroditum]|uniref:Uncharacterized protein n=1 Tax=Steinernema hermaphroditum TaxID=289476 RepID=A0AA39IGH6_9BILA|nr:hypothetical protein QR680_007987 [Steinernema hermaphroditum]
MYLPSDSNVFKTMITFANFLSAHSVLPSPNMEVYIDGCFVGMMFIDYILQIGIMAYPILELRSMSVFFYFLIGLASIATAYRSIFIAYAALWGIVSSRVYVVFCVFRVVLSLSLFPIFAFFVCLIRNIEALYIYGIVGMIVSTILDILYLAYLKTYHKKNIAQSTCDSTVMYNRA